MKEGGGRGTIEENRIYKAEQADDSWIIYTVLMIRGLNDMMLVWSL